MEENKKKKLLLVEDEKTTAILEKRILEKHGYEVVNAFSGEQALEISKQDFSIDLILMDINLGAGMDGTQAAKEILETREIPIVFLSSHTEIEVVQKTEGISSYGYIVKNSGETVLIASIRMAFRHRDAYYRIYEQNQQLEANNEELKHVLSQLEETNHLQMQTEEALRRSEEEVRRKLEAITNSGEEPTNLHLSDIIDVQALQTLMDEFYQITKIGVGIIDLQGNILVKTGWQDICLSFHRLNPQTLVNCLQSDIYLSEGVTPGEFRAYHCKNCMWDMVTPIMLGKVHIGNLFLGQFFFEDEIPDYKVFEQQAEVYGFDKEKYMQAIKQVPRWSHETTMAVMRFYSNLAKMISDLNLKTLKMAQAVSEKNRLLQSLRKSEERWQFAIEGSGDGLWDWNIQKGELFLSSQWKALHGYADSDLSNSISEWETRVHPDDKKHVLQKIQQHFEAQTPIYRSEYRFLCKDGSYHWVLDRGKIMDSDEHGQPLRMIGTHSDISDRKKSEAALRENEEKYRSLVESIQDAVVILDFSGNILFVNFSTLLLLQESVVERVVGKNITDFLLPESLQQAFLDSERIKKGERVTAEYSFQRVSGEVLWVEATGYRTVFQGKEADMVLLRDITVRRKMAADLKESEQRYDSFINADTDMIFAKDENSKYIIVNDQLARFFGRSKNEIYYKTDFDLMPYENAQACQCTDMKALHTHSAVVSEETFGEKIIETTKFQLPLRDGKVGVGGILRDVTEKRKSEEALSKAFEEKEMLLRELQHRVKNE